MQAILALEDGRVFRGKGYGAIEESPCQMEQRRQCQRADEQHRGPRDHRRVTENLPGDGEVDHHQRRVRVGKSGRWNQLGVKKKIARCRHVITGFVPEIG